MIQVCSEYDNCFRYGKHDFQLSDRVEVTAVNTILHKDVLSVNKDIKNILITHWETKTIKHHKESLKNKYFSLRGAMEGGRPHPVRSCSPPYNSPSLLRRGPPVHFYCNARNIIKGCDHITWYPHPPFRISVLHLRGGILLSKNLKKKQFSPPISIFHLCFQGFF